MLEEITKWMAVNSEGIYGTRPWKMCGQRRDRPPAGKPLSTSGLARTSPPTTSASPPRAGPLYAFVMGWPEREAVIPTLAEGGKLGVGKIRSVELLGHRGKLKFTQDRQGLRVALPPEKPSDARGGFQDRRSLKRGRGGATLKTVRLALFALFRIHAGASTHPLAPLTAAEIRVTAEIMEADHRIPATARYQHRRAGRTRLKTRCCATPPPPAAPSPFSTTMRATAPGRSRQPGDAQARPLQQVPGAQPMVTGDDSTRADQIVRADPRWQRAMLARGIRDLNNVVIIAWTAGYFALPGTEQGTCGARHAVLLRRQHAQLLRASDRRRGGARESHHRQDTGAAGYRSQPADSARKRRACPRSSTCRSATPPAPLKITQPTGPGFRIEDGEVRWQKWRFR